MEITSRVQVFGEVEEITRAASEVRTRTISVHRGEMLEGLDLLPHHMSTHHGVLKRKTRPPPVGLIHQDPEVEGKVVTQQGALLLAEDGADLDHQLLARRHPDDRRLVSPLKTELGDLCRHLQSGRLKVKDYSGPCWDIPSKSLGGISDPIMIFGDDGVGEGEESLEVSVDVGVEGRRSGAGREVIGWYHPSSNRIIPEESSSICTESGEAGTAESTAWRISKSKDPFRSDMFELLDENG
jgi:hypothetical protein